MQSAPPSGGQGQGGPGGPATPMEPTTVERLEHVRTLLAQKKPWPAFLGVAARGENAWKACPSPVQEALAWMATAGVEVLDTASVGPLKPVCQAFKALIEAAQGAARNEQTLQRLVSWCAFLTTVLIQHGQAVGPLAHVQKPIDDFVATTNQLAAFAAKLAKGSKCRALCCHRIDLAALTDYEEDLRRISNDIALVDGIAHRQETKALARDLRPPELPDMAAVPAGAPPEPHNFVKRPALQEAVDYLVNPDEALAPYTVVGIGGGGKTVLVSAVVRNSSVRERFRGGIFWIGVGRGAKNSLLPLLQGLAREMGTTATDAPHKVSHVFDSLDQVKLHLSAAAASEGTLPRLVVLDDVWEREVVDTLLSLKLKLLVTTRDRSIGGGPESCLELGGMTDNEALELLLKTSETKHQPGNDVKAPMTKVVALSGRLPLVLAIAGSMAAVKGKGLTAGAWEELIAEFESSAAKMEACGEQLNSVNLVMETSFNALSNRRKTNFKKMAVLAAGATAPIEMLLNLWETEDVKGARDEAEGLASKCLLQHMGGDRYRVHDLLLEFATIKLKADVEMAKKAAALQARHLGRLDVVEGYEDPEHGAGDQGLFFLDALWRSVEKLSGNPKLEVSSYRASLAELESGGATADVADSYSSVGKLFHIQGKYDEARPLYERSRAIRESTPGPDHPVVAASINNRAGSNEEFGGARLV